MAGKATKYQRSTDWDTINQQMRQGGRQEGQTPEQGTITRADSHLPGVWLMTKTYTGGERERWLQRKDEP